MIINNIDLEDIELRYRIWDTLHNRWFQGATDDKSRQLRTDAISFFGETMMLGEHFRDQNEDDVWRDMHINDRLEHLVVVPSTGCKDYYGKEIFFGDILCKEEYRETCYVFYSSGAYRTEGGYGAEQKTLDKFLYDPNSFHARVIGNIFENPELLNLLEH